jgi:hypothetical protein
MEAQALADSLQRSRDRLRAELFSADGEDTRLAGLVPRSAIMSFLLAPERRGLMLTALSTLMSFAGRARGGKAGGSSGMRRLMWMVLALWLGRRRR